MSSDTPSPVEEESKKDKTLEEIIIEIELSNDPDWFRHLFAIERNK